MSTPTATTTTMQQVASDACDEAAIGDAASPAPFRPAPTTTGPGPSWDEHTLIAGTCPQVVDPAVGAGFALVSHVPTDQGPWVLQRIDIDRATTETGATFSVGSLTVAAGYLWISCGRSIAGDSTGPLLCQVDPSSLAVVRQIQLPRPSPPPQSSAPQRSVSNSYQLSVAQGPGATVWVGYDRTLVHIATGDGELLTSVPIASGTVASVSVDPALHSLYVALSYPTVAGQTVDAAVVEFDARTGQLLAATPETSEVTDSVAGGALTAVPGGVWMSFRTGMLGETLLLRQSDLAVVGPSVASLAGQPDGVFRWIMDASTIYGDGALFVVNENGVMACADPRLGVVRAQQHLAAAQGNSFELLAVDPTSGQVLATDGNGLQSITPPSSCRV